MWADAEIATKYVELKKALTMCYEEDRKTYTDSKTNFIQNALKQYKETCND